MDSLSVLGGLAQLSGYVGDRCIALELRAQGHPVSFPDNPVLVDAELVDGIGDPEGWRPKRLSPEARRLLTSRLPRSAEF